MSELQELLDEHGREVYHDAYRDGRATGKNEVFELLAKAHHHPSCYQVIISKTKANITTNHSDIDENGKCTNCGEDIGF